MTTKAFEHVFTPETLSELFPEGLADRFFEGLYGDPQEGAYGISLIFKGQNQNLLSFEFQLRQRPGKCLACNLTYGLPEVFSRHPVIDIKGLVKRIDHLLDGQARCSEWKLGPTREVSNQLHVIPLSLTLEPKGG